MVPIRQAVLPRPYAQIFLSSDRERHLWPVIGLPPSTGEIDMRKFLIATALLSITAGSAFAQAGTPQGNTNVPNPPHAASSNDMSKSPGAGMPGATTGSNSMTTGSATHKKTHPKKKQEHKKQDHM